MPRISAAQRDRNHASIVSAAAGAFRARGIDAVGIDEVMRATGMTHGGFYNHFASKGALAVEVFDTQFGVALQAVSDLIQAQSDQPGTALAAAVDAYLSQFHRDHVEVGCPSASMVSDAARHGRDVQSSYAAGTRSYLDCFARMITERAAADGVIADPEEVRRLAVTTYAELVGAMTLARAVADVDPELSDELLETSREHLRRIRTPEGPATSATASPPTGLDYTR